MGTPLAQPTTKIRVLGGVQLPKVIEGVKFKDGVEASTATNAEEAA